MTEPGTPCRAVWAFAAPRTIVDPYRHNEGMETEIPAEEPMFQGRMEDRCNAEDALQLDRIHLVEEQYFYEDFYEEQYHSGIFMKSSTTV